MLLEIPFYKNDGNRCMQAAMQSVLKYFLNKNFTLEELDKFTGRKENYWTWTPQGAAALHELGLKVKYYSKSDLKLFLQGKEFIRKYYDKEAEKILKFTDLPVILESIKKVLKYNIFEKRKLPFKEIEYHIEKGHVPIVLIDWNRLVGKSAYQGHYVVVTGFDKQNIYFHQSGPKNPKANCKVPKTHFIDAWNADGTDNDVIIVYGSR